MVTNKVVVSAAVSLAMLAFAASASAAPLAYCKADAERICPGAHGKAALKCLKEHENDVSIGCAKELKKIKAELGK